VDPILEMVERSNQRGKRTLSVVDLIEAGTLDVALAAWLVERVRGGASYLVGARPGAAGKTTIMSALLAMLPPLAKGRAIRLADRGTGWERSAPGDCVVAFEIGHADLESYIWGKDVVHFAALARKGVQVVTNLHADTVEEARGQIVEQCGAKEVDFEAIGLFVPIHTKVARGASKRDMTRTVPEVMVHEGAGWRAFTAKEAEEALAGGADGGAGARLRATAAFLEDCRERGVAGAPGRVEVAESPRAAGA
jgi:hypothetical protein